MCTGSGISIYFGEHSDLGELYIDYSDADILKAVLNLVSEGGSYMVLEKRND